MGTLLGADGAAVYRTPVHGFPLPPPVPGRAAPVFNGNSQYVLPDPKTGEPTSYTRASTVAKTLEDTWMLEAWAKRMLLLGIQDSPQLRAQLDRIVLGHVPDEEHPEHIAKALRNPLNAVAARAEQSAGSHRSAEFGTAVHAWCEWVDLGLGHLTQVPEIFTPWVQAHLRILAENGLTVDRYWTERVVLNTRYGIAGTLDRLFWDCRGDLFLGDIKTSAGLQYSWLYFAIQLAIYHSAEYVLSVDGTAWEPMPALDPDVALISHLARENPDQAAIVPLNMVFGHDALATAMEVRAHRRDAKRYAQSVLYQLGCTDPASARWYLARYLVETSRTEDEMATVWEHYQDVWTDDLTALARNVLALLDQ